MGGMLVRTELLNLHLQFQHPAALPSKTWGEKPQVHNLALAVGGRHPRDRGLLQTLPRRLGRRLPPAQALSVPPVRRKSLEEVVPRQTLMEQPRLD